mmetsp:Transcript_116996/g.212879  ORF Transcript_116996/g.212879 Transcript_116996/m.212879 type:complete len:265 (-) Transcript_116996:133-927(-)
MRRELLHQRPASLVLLAAVLCCAAPAADGRLLQRRSSSGGAGSETLPVVDGSEIVIKVFEPRTPGQKSAEQVLNDLMFNVANENMRSIYLKKFLGSHGLDEEVKLTPLRRGVLAAGGDRVAMPHVTLNETEAKKVDIQAPAPAPAAFAYSGLPMPGSLPGERTQDPRVKPPGAASGLPRVWTKGGARAEAEKAAVDEDNKFRYRLLLHNPDLRTAGSAGSAPTPASAAVVDPIAAFGPAAADEISSPHMQIADDAYDVDKSDGG